MMGEIVFEIARRASSIGVRAVPISIHIARRAPIGESPTANGMVGRTIATILERLRRNVTPSISARHTLPN